MKRRCAITVSLDEEQMAEYYKAKKKNPDFTNICAFMIGIKAIIKGA